MKAIVTFGSVDQKEKYLPKLSNGEFICGFCLTGKTPINSLLFQLNFFKLLERESGSDAAAIETRARLNNDKTHYILNGEKAWAINGGIADVFIVFAKAPAIGIPQEEERGSLNFRFVFEIME